MLLAFDHFDFEWAFLTVSVHILREVRLQMQVGLALILYFHTSFAKSFFFHCHLACDDRFARVVVCTEFVKLRALSGYHDSHRLLLLLAFRLMSGFNIYNLLFVRCLALSGLTFAISFPLFYLQRTLGLALIKQLIEAELFTIALAHLISIFVDLLERMIVLNTDSISLIINHAGALTRMEIQYSASATGASSNL